MPKRSILSPYFTALIIAVGLSLVTEGHSQLKNDCSVSYQVSDIPRGAIREIKRIYKERLSLANPKEKYQVTDVFIGNRFKKRRLVLSAKCSNEFILVYEHGGFGTHEHVLLLSRNKNSYRIIKNIYSDNTKSVSEAKERLAVSEVEETDHY